MPANNTIAQIQALKTTMDAALKTAVQNFETASGYQVQSITVSHNGVTLVSVWAVVEIRLT